MTTPNRWAVKSVARCTFVSLTDGKILTYLDTLKSSGVATKSATVYARGGDGNVKLIGFSSDKEATVTLQDALFDNKVMALLTGNALVEGAKEIYKRDVKTTTTQSLTLDKTPVGDPVGVFALNADGSNGTEYTKGTPETNPDEYSITGKVLTFNTAVTDNTSIVVYYKLNSGTSAKTIRVTSDAFGGSFKLIMDVFVTDYATKVLYPAQLTVFNCKITDDWKLD